MASGGVRGCKQTANMLNTTSRHNSLSMDGDFAVGSQISDCPTLHDTPDVGCKQGVTGSSPVSGFAECPTQTGFLRPSCTEALRFRAPMEAFWKRSRERSRSERFENTAHRSQTVTPAPLRRCWSPTQDWGPPSARLTPLHDNARNGLITRRARVRIPPPLSRPTRA